MPAMLRAPWPLALTVAALIGCGAERAGPSAVDEDDDTTEEDDGAGAVDDDSSEDDDSPAAERSDAGARIDAGSSSAPQERRDAAIVDARSPERADASASDASTDGAIADDGGTARDASRDAASSTPASDASAASLPGFHIALRVHREDSGLTGAKLAAALEEVNEIWWKQAAICFEVEVVRNGELRRDGFDLWFHRSRLGCNASGNGVYCGDHDIHTLDAPSLNPANTAAWDSRQNPARTTAHELGHGLNLAHYNGYPDSNDSLMSSGRQGFKLHEQEIATARRRARDKALPTSSALPCAPVPVVD